MGITTFPRAHDAAVSHVTHGEFAASWGDDDDMRVGEQKGPLEHLSQRG
jgi:hypothetical protein